MPQELPSKWRKHFQELKYCKNVQHFNFTNHKTSVDLGEYFIENVEKSLPKSFLTLRG